MREAIKTAAQSIVFGQEPGEGYLAIEHLYKIFSDATGVYAGNAERHDDILTATGKAISPVKAAHCLLERGRSSVFMRGIYKAIVQLQKDFPGECIQILYAGCGPYATLLTPITMFFTPQEISISLMDINKDALDSAVRLFDAAGLNDYIAETICADASDYKMPAGRTFHLVVSETMQHALQREPQVSIMQCLVPQMHEKAIFIPQNIRVNAALLDGQMETRHRLEPEIIPERLDLGLLYSIGRDNVSPQQPVTVSIPGDTGTFSWFVMLTHITVYGDEELGIDDCSLTMPKRISWKMEDYRGKKVTFTYVIGTEPGFQYTVE